MKRDVLYHCSITLKMGNQEWGPKPFRFNNCWLSHPGFDKLVVDCWSDENFSRWKALVIREKLKQLRSVIRNWNGAVYGNIDSGNL